MWSPVKVLVLPGCNIFLCNNQLLGEHSKRKLQNFGHMSKIGLPYVPCTLIWTKKKVGQVLFCLPYLPTQKVWTFWVCSISTHFVRNLIQHNFLKPSLTFIKITYLNQTVSLNFYYMHPWQWFANEGALETIFLFSPISILPACHENCKLFSCVNTAIKHLNMPK